MYLMVQELRRRDRLRLGELLSHERLVEITSLAALEPVTTLQAVWLRLERFEDTVRSSRGRHRELHQSSMNQLAVADAPERAGVVLPAYAARSSNECDGNASRKQPSRW